MWAVEFVRNLWGLNSIAWWLERDGYSYTRLLSKLHLCQCSAVALVLSCSFLFFFLPDWIAGVFIQWLDQPGWDDFYPDGTLWPCFYTPRGKPGADVIAAAFAQPPRGP